MVEQTHTISGGEGTKDKKPKIPEARIGYRGKGSQRNIVTKGRNWEEIWT